MERKPYTAGQIFISISRIGKLIETENRKEERRNGEILLNGNRVSAWGDAKVQETVVMVIQHENDHN